MIAGVGSPFFSKTKKRKEEIEYSLVKIRETERQTYLNRAPAVTVIKDQFINHQISFPLQSRIRHVLSFPEHH